jgi:SAM-dependent methyltransferase
MIAPPEVLPRLRSVIDRLPIARLPPRLLNVGCGAFPSAGVLRAALPGWTMTGVDLDRQALRTAAIRRTAARQRSDADQPPGRLHLVQADAAALPLQRSARFGLVLVRHPDVFRRRAWAEIIPRLPERLVPGGLLVIMVYAPEEVRLIRALPLSRDFPLDEDDLSPPDLAGRDRFVLVFGPEA